MTKKLPTLHNGLRFLLGGGEMGELTRTYDWASTPLGTPDKWPASLNTTLGILLHSAFPMFLFWGDDLTCFYNDAYRPSLGTEGKHPAVGKNAKEVWPEIWEFISPLIEQVKRTAEPVWFEDQLLPIFRNGKLEDVYWTFSYSPVYGEDGNVNGVFVTCTETTEKVKTLRSMEESEQRFKTMAEGTNILIAVADETSNAVFFNKAWTELVGRPQKDLLQYGWLDLIHEDDQKHFLNIYLDAFKLQVPYTGEFRVLNRHGEYRWLLSQGPPRFHPDGSFAGYISSSIDITERKEIEKRLQSSELQMRAMIENAPFPIAVYIGLDMQVEFANQSILDIWGKGNDVIGKSFRDVLPELDNQEVFRQIDEVLSTGEAFHIYNQQLDLIVNGKNKPYYFNYSLTPLFDNTGKVYGVMNTGVDLTELNLAKMAIQKSEENLRNTILQSPVAMGILKGTEHVVELANERMFEIWGKTPDEVMDKPIFTGLPEAKGQGLEDLLANVYTTGETFSAQGVPVNLPRNGIIETVYLNFVYEAFRGADSEIWGIVVVAIDVTEQVLARQKIEEVVAERTKELANTNTSLQRSNAELAQFAYIASHDLQEPLRKISTFSQMLEERTADSIDEQSKKYLEKINASAIRMNTLIRDVLKYSELEKEAETYTKVDLNEVLSNILTDYDLLIEQKKAEIQYNELPVIEAIPLQMSQLFGNIIGNSLKFAKTDVSPCIKIVTSVLSKEDKKKFALNSLVQYVKIQFSDNGIGFKEEYADKIFSIFQRLHRKSEYEGTGIGLAMCKKIALNHHGDLNACGSSEKGAVFNVVLPLKQ